MGEEKLDDPSTRPAACATCRPRRRQGRPGHGRLGSGRAESLERFESSWWFGPTADQYADSLQDPGNQKVFQRHWIGLTPIEAEIPRSGSRTGPLASTDHARLAVAKREESCYSGEYGLFHTGSAGCDTETSTVPAERTVFTLNTSIMASMALQAWGTYGILWPVVHFQLGIAPDVGRDRLTVVPQVPDGQSQVSGRNVRLGKGSVDVAATRDAQQLTTRVTRSTKWQLTIGALVPEGASVRVRARLDGHPVPHQVAQTARGTEIRVDAGDRKGTSTLVVALD